MKRQIILASSSPRRIEMLKQKGFDPIIRKPDIDENIDENTDMKEAVCYLALKKGLAVEASFAGQFPDQGVIIAADTVVFNGRIIGKPESREEAFRILQDLNGKSHYVATGVALIEPASFNRRVFYELTRVYFKQYTEEDILRYIDTDEPYDKAGGYAIQGNWGPQVDYIEGDYDNVIGFPFQRIMKELMELDQHSSV
jgi:septum formation protein